MAELTYFSVVGNYFAAAGDGPYDAGDPALVPMSGVVTITPMITSGDTIEAATLTPPKNLLLAPIKANIKQGRIQVNGEDGVRLVADTAVLNLDGDLFYRVEFREGLVARGVKYPLKSFTFQAPSTDTVVDLVTVTPVAGSTAIENLGGAVSSVAGRFGNVLVYVDDLQQLTAVGKAVAKATTSADARTALGIDLIDLDEWQWYANSAAFPATGVSDKVYGARDTKAFYRWDGSAYVVISMTLKVDGVQVSTYDLDTTPITPTDIGAYTISETDAAISAAVSPNPQLATIKDINGNTSMAFFATPGAVNFIRVDNSVLNSHIVSFVASGTDSDINFSFTPKGTVPKVSIYAGAATTATWGVAGSGSDVNSNITTQGAGVVQANGVEVLTRSSIHAFTAKTTPVSADEFALVDSAASNAMKKITYANLQATIAASILNGAPAQLDTLKELADAINDDASYAATVNTALSARVLVASPVLSAVPTGSGVSTSATASTVAIRDSNARLAAFGIIPSSGSTVTSAGTLTLSITDAQVQELTGTTTHTVKLPTTSVTKGMEWFIINNSTGDVTVQSSAAATICVVRTGRGGRFVAAADAPTTAAQWLANVPTTSNVASTVMMRDANQNVFANNYITGSLPVTAAAGTTVMTVGTANAVAVTGTTANQTVQLPTTGVAVGQTWTVVNQTTSGTVTVTASDTSTVTTVAAGAAKTFQALQATPTASTHWRSY